VNATVSKSSAVSAGLCEAGEDFAIRATEVTKVFTPRGRVGFAKGRSVHALGPVTLDVRPFEFLAIIGPSGCGKSTLLRLLAGLLPVSGGRVDRREDVQKAGGMSMVFQTPALLPWRTTLGNVMAAAGLLGLEQQQAKKRALELLEHVGLEHFAKALPSELSGGMQQRTAVCRALLGRPQVLFMDEPFGALDAITREQLTWDLQEVWLQNENSVVFVTHNIEEAILLADRVLVMTARPGVVGGVVQCDLPRPRTVESLASPRFTELSIRLRTLLEEAMGARAPRRLGAERTGGEGAQ
jgi:NitT/TauT family transport system ATP-binding protein